jgi:hypothetical protein
MKVALSTKLCCGIYFSQEVYLVKKRLVLLLVCGILVFAASGCGNKVVESSVEVETMQRFPSYDWDAEDNRMLAYVAANTPGSEVNKQKAILCVLDVVWETGTSITTYVERNYELYNQPTTRDYELVQMVIFGEWAKS